jgi:crossover junction endodeoxyribonuclease RusA
MTLSFTLPYPPSVNTYWRHPSRGPLAGRHLISQEGRAYREAIRAHVAELKDKTVTGPVAVDIEAFFPDRRKRDLDNILKSLLDSLTHAGVWEDDSQIVDLRIRKGPTIAGMVKVFVTPMKDAA